MRRVLHLCVVAAAALVAGCSTLGYYAQLARGEYDLLDARRPISRVIADPETPPALRAKLRLALAARSYACRHLDLPCNASYTLYADLHRAEAGWNVFATPEFSVRPIEHCFPVAGCVAYRGYFDPADAHTEAERLRARGDDVAVFGVAAFSTLGWFDDPVLNTMLRWGDDELVGVIFHELAHQKIYVAGDTRFNESYASFVERQGLRQWRASRGLTAGDDAAQRRADQFARLMLATRDRLRALYRQPLPADMLRARKADVFARLRLRYRRLRDADWKGYAGYDRFFRRPLNNASLLPFGLYDQWLPGFTRLYRQAGASWPRFFAAVQRLADESKARRDAMLTRLTAAQERVPT